MSVQAEELFKKAASKTGNMIFNDHEGAFDYFNKAGAAFKAEANFSRAGDAYMRAGDLAFGKLDNPVDACTAYTECAKCYARTPATDKASSAIQAAVKLNIDNGRLSQAARLLQNWGETCESVGNVEGAIAAYKRSAELFFAEDSKQSVISCKLKIANLLATGAKMFGEASKLFEEVGMYYAQSTSKTMAKPHFFNSFICRVAAIPPENRMEGSAALADALEMISSFDPYFRNTREMDVCQLLCECDDEDKIDEAIRTMDNFKMLGSDLTVKVMNHIKDNFSNTR